jgi:hypothetical protein
MGLIVGARGIRTWRQTLLELLGLIRVLEHERVDEARGPDLELDVVGLGVLLYAGGCRINLLAKVQNAAVLLHLLICSECCFLACPIARSFLRTDNYGRVHPESPPLPTIFRHTTAPNAVGKQRTFRILAPANLDELLDVADFGRHGDGNGDGDGYLRGRVRVGGPTIIRAAAD